MASKPDVNNELERRQLLLKALQAQNSEVDCNICQSQLDDYIAAQLNDQDYLAQFPEVALHLDCCLECASAYARLYELELAEMTAALPQPAQTPEPDLSFLLVQPTSPGDSQDVTLSSMLQTAIQRIGNRVRLQLSGDLLRLLRPPPGPVAVRGASESGRYTEKLLILELDEDDRSILPLTLAVYRDAHNPQLCLIEATIEPPGRHWPNLAGLSVTLVGGEEQRESITDAWGSVSFRDIPVDGLANLAIEFDL